MLVVGTLAPSTHPDFFKAREGVNATLAWYYPPWNRFTSSSFAKIETVTLHRGSGAGILFGGRPGGSCSLISQAEVGEGKRGLRHLTGAQPLADLLMECRAKIPHDPVCSFAYEAIAAIGLRQSASR
jgi:hypothetical protein